jgi:hypothetical protein
MIELTPVPRPPDLLLRDAVEAPETTPFAGIRETFIRRARDQDISGDKECPIELRS